MFWRLRRPRPARLKSLEIGGSTPHSRRMAEESQLPPPWKVVAGMLVLVLLATAIGFLISVVVF